jgi:hypothetical protein
MYSQQLLQPHDDSSVPRLVWFLLVDSNGHPYKGSSPSSVSLPPTTSVIDQFRDAVKVKYDQPNFLKEIPAATLQVFKNKSAYNEDKDKDKAPLKSSRPLDGLGLDEDQALLVMVPDSFLILRRFSNNISGSY